MSVLLGKTHFRNMNLLRFLKFVAIVPQGEEHVLEKFGKFDKVVSPGIQFYWPFIQQNKSCMHDLFRKEKVSAR